MSCYHCPDDPDLYVVAPACRILDDDILDVGACNAHSRNILHLHDLDNVQDSRFLVNHILDVNVL